jgi:hypothetical protein
MLSLDGHLDDGRSGVRKLERMLRAGIDALVSPTSKRASQAAPTAAHRQPGGESAPKSGRRRVADVPSGSTLRANQRG